ncbi:hypothetical protein TWF106_009522 [Orbilia oligospora]|uniref:Uncharacterized protein n=1 Tax=Orbilia oligospora TaxID=2813651 RepID=A0A6G1MK89_ORBOL|nr:hypothetical protein TWF788_004559 [Orbilia oligospora]KAF3202620.1 hypothetical protein TWF679_010714 [Orbilia oligospora]KAF3213395.1 hypothetical protein TWF106_009522 [Orbilia oligospora]KAF3229967.1 hypothetical protein TWF191_000870 [Orbilia oligospora]KAF3260605.1 hypothetical protein TWF192_009886 [Orbilia oligospora]
MVSIAASMIREDMDFYQQDGRAHRDMTPPKTECDMAGFPIEKGDCDKRKRRRLGHASCYVCPVTYRLVRKPTFTEGSVGTALAKRGLSKPNPPGESLIRIIERRDGLKRFTFQRNCNLVIVIGGGRDISNSMALFMSSLENDLLC